MRTLNSPSTNLPETPDVLRIAVSLSATKATLLSPDHAIAISPLSSASCARSQMPSTVRSGVRSQPSPQAHGISGANCPRCRTSPAPAFPGCEPARTIPISLSVSLLKCFACLADKITAEWSICTHSINSGPQNVEDALRDQPRQADLALQLRNAKCLDAMNDGKQGAQAHGNEHEGAKRSPSRRAETWEQHNHHGRCPDGCDLCYVVIVSLSSCLGPEYNISDSTTSSTRVIASGSAQMRFRVQPHKHAGSKPKKPITTKPKTHHRPINPNPFHILRETVVNRRYETAPDK